MAMIKNSTANVSVITKTIYGAGLQIAKVLGIPYDILKLSTLNEALNIMVNESLNPNGDVTQYIDQTTGHFTPEGIIAANSGNYKYPVVKYMAIGNGGLISNCDPMDVTPINVPSTHESGDGTSYSPLPFIMREINDDINADLRKKYALRKIMKYGDTQYYCYYLKRINLESAVINYQMVTVKDGKEVARPWSPSNDNLFPKKRIPSVDKVNLGTGDYLQVVASIKFALTEEDCEEIRQCCNIIYGSSQKAIISELGLVSGLDRLISVPSIGNTKVDFMEAISTQVFTHIITNHDLNFDNDGIEMSIDCGATEPLLKLKANEYSITLPKQSG